MPGVTKRTKQKTALKASPVQNEKKFISESVSFNVKLIKNEIPK